VQVERKKDREEMQKELFRYRRYSGLYFVLSQCQYGSGTDASFRIHARLPYVPR